MAIEKGILLAGGHGTRLYPLTSAVNKHLLPVYDKPMVYYPLSTLLLAGVRKVLVIVRGMDTSAYRTLLGDGSQWGIRIDYEVQEQPNGIAESLLIAESFLDGDPSILALGDNIFFGSGLGEMLRRASHDPRGATLLAYKVKDPRGFAVVEFDDDQVVSLVEKPERPKSFFAVPGFYFFDGQASKLAARLNPSTRGELEITDLNLAYLERGLLRAIEAPRGIAWLDAGTHDGLHKASGFVQAVQERQGLLVASPEEVAFHMGLISPSQFRRLIAAMGAGSYREYLEARAAAL